MNDEIAGMRRQILRNIADGRQPYVGIKDPETGAHAIRSWDGWWRYITYEDGRLALTDQGKRELTPDTIE